MSRYPGDNDSIFYVFALIKTSIGHLKDVLPRPICFEIGFGQSLFKTS